MRCLPRRRCHSWSRPNFPSTQRSTVATCRSSQGWTSTSIGERPSISVNQYCWIVDLSQCRVACHGTPVICREFAAGDLSDVPTLLCRAQVHIIRDRVRLRPAGEVRVSADSGAQSPCLDPVQALQPCLTWPRTRCAQALQVGFGTCPQTGQVYSVRDNACRRVTWMRWTCRPASCWSRSLRPPTSPTWCG